MFLVVIGAIGEGSLPCGLVWTGVDFSVCVVAPPGERSVGASRWDAARRGVEVSVEGPPWSTTLRARLALRLGIEGVMLRLCADLFGVEGGGGRETAYPIRDVFPILP